MGLKQRIINYLKKTPGNRTEIIKAFKDDPKLQVNRTITNLLIDNKLALKDKRYCIAKKPSKMGNIRVTIDNINFDSKKEGNRYSFLKMLMNTGKLTELKMQVPFIVIDSVMWEDRKLSAIKYVVDFTYIDEKGILIAEDVKGRVLDVYKLKRSLFIQRYPEYKFIET